MYSRKLGVLQSSTSLILRLPFCADFGAVGDFLFCVQIADRRSLRDSVCVSGGRCAARRPSQAMFIANFSYEVISAPIYAGISLMAMSHAAGLKTQTRHITKGLQFTIPVILATLFSLLLQGVAGMILPFLSMYLSVAFSNSLLLICEKKVPPMQSLLLSLRAVNKKIFPLIAIYSILMVLFMMAVLLYGIGLVLFLPFFFHVKGIIYRNMFGIRLKIIATDQAQPDQPDNNNSSGIFDA